MNSQALFGYSLPNLRFELLVLSYMVLEVFRKNLYSFLLA